MHGGKETNLHAESQVNYRHYSPKGVDISLSTPSRGLIHDDHTSSF